MTEVRDVALLWAALMLAGGLAVLLWLLADWLMHPNRATRPPLPAPTTVLVPGRLAPGDPDNRLGPPVIPGHGSRLVTDDDMRRLEQWLTEQTPA
jgi:hypothetical protein